MAVTIAWKSARGIASLNKRVRPGSGFRPQLETLTLRQLAALADDEFRALFRDSPVKRIKRPRFVRNVCVALGNVGTPEDLTILNQLARDPDPLIAEHASWAVEQIRNRQDQTSDS